MNVQRSELWLLNSQQLLCTKYFLPGPTSTLDLGLASNKYIVVYEFKIGDWRIPVWYIVAGSLWGEKSQPMMNMPFQMFSNSENIWCFTEFVRTESSNEWNHFLQSSSVWGQIRNCLLTLSLGFCSVITCISLEWCHSSFAWRELAQCHHYIFMWFCGEVKINRGLSSPVTTMMDFSCFIYFLLNTSLWTTSSSFLNMIEWGDCVQA